MSHFDSSDDESQPFDESEFQIDWLELTAYGCTVDVALSGLPGCKFKETWRKLPKDIEIVQNAEISDVFVLCTKGELNKYRVPSLLEDMSVIGLNIHHYPFPDGQIPTMNNLNKMLNEIKQLLKDGKKSLIHCYGGLGRTCLVAACLLMILNTELTSKEAIECVRKLKGPRAIQTVKQYNFVNEFREKYDDTEIERSVSR